MDDRWFIQSEASAISSWAITFGCVDCLSITALCWYHCVILRTMGCMTFHTSTEKSCHPNNHCWNEILPNYISILLNYVNVVQTQICSFVYFQVSLEILFIYLKRLRRLKMQHGVSIFSGLWERRWNFVKMTKPIFKGRTCKNTS